MGKTQRKTGHALDASQPVDDDMNTNRDAPNTTLRGRWLLAARFGWIAVATLTLGLVTAGVVVALDRPDLIRERQFGPPSRRQGYLTRSSWLVAFIVPIAAAVATGLLIFWRRSGVHPRGVDDIP